jgi:hypothetical protein
MTNHPIVDAHRDGVHLMFWCKYCNREHSHGVCGRTPGCDWRPTDRNPVCICPTGSGDGHRAAHCHNPDSPYRDGYVLREVPA